MSNFNFQQKKKTAVNINTFQFNIQRTIPYIDPNLKLVNYHHHLKLMNREKVSDTHRTSNLLQKQSSGGVHMKKSSENMQQIYRRTLMPKYDFNATLFKSHFGICVLLLHIFRTSFLKKTPGGLLLLLTVICTCKKECWEFIHGNVVQIPVTNRKPFKRVRLRSIIFSNIPTSINFNQIQVNKNF